MRVYLVVRTDKVGWEETHSVVVVADNPDTAVLLAKTTPGNQRSTVWDQAIVTEVVPGNMPRVVLEAFRAE